MRETTKDNGKVWKGKEKRKLWHASCRWRKEKKNINLEQVCSEMKRSGLQRQEILGLEKIAIEGP